jgi:hypothetical protein
MPFLDDTSPREEVRGPTWAAFATIAGQVERLITVNVAWALVCVPGVIALAYPELPGWLRLVLGLLSATALPPALAVLYSLAGVACRDQHVDLGLTRELVRTLSGRGLRVLGPLYGTFGVLIWIGLFAAARGLSAVTTAATLLILLWSVCATYWGPLFAREPERSARELALESVQLTRRYPAQSLTIWLVSGLAVVVGAVSIVGLVLIVPVLVALLHTHRLEGLTRTPARP